MTIPSRIHKKNEPKIKKNAFAHFYTLVGLEIKMPCKLRRTMPCKRGMSPRSVLFAEAVGLRLAAVCATALVALFHAGAEGNVDAWRSREAERLGNLDKVEAVDVEDAAQAVRCICLEV